jgi:NAD(P)-dependent dehydrogenase (short-subunit alcohol dehydrogenase family)
MAERSAKAEASERGVSAEKIWEERNAMYLPGRVVTPREVAEVIAFLASEESGGVSGQAITVALGSEC